MYGFVCKKALIMRSGFRELLSQLHRHVLSASCEPLRHSKRRGGLLGHFANKQDPWCVSPLSADLLFSTRA